MRASRGLSPSRPPLRLCPRASRRRWHLRSSHDLAGALPIRALPHPPRRESHRRSHARVFPGPGRGPALDLAGPRRERRRRPDEREHAASVVAGRRNIPAGRNAGFDRRIPRQCGAPPLSDSNATPLPRREDPAAVAGRRARRPNAPRPSCPVANAAERARVVVVGRRFIFRRVGRVRRGVVIGILKGGPRG